MPDRRCLLFLCSGNSCRSQMAEGFARSFHGDRLEVASAGIVATRVDPLAIEVMREVGVDISTQQSNAVAEFLEEQFDLVVTVCSEADKNCPTLPGVSRLHHQPFDDPPVLAAQTEDPEEKKAHYRRVRDEIAEFCRRLPELCCS